MTRSVARNAILWTLISTSLAWGAPAVQMRLGKGSRLWLEGKSTLHPYEAQAQQFSTTFGVEQAEGAADGGKPSTAQLIREHAVERFDLSVPVNRLSSGEDGLDNNLRKAMKADEHPNITFWMTSYEVLPSSSASGLMGVRLHGVLSMAGVERKVDLDAQGRQEPDGFRLKGSKGVLMSDYGVKAPVLMLGMLKTDDLVTVKFDLLIQTT